MSVLYNIGILLYYLLVRVISPFHSRARSFIEGQKHLFQTILSEDLKGKWVWFHTASAGEFEQARPVIERVKSDYPKIRLLLTFYSPSGFEFAKKYPYADLVTILPIDNQANSQCFISSFDLILVCFVKGEFWLNYLNALNRQSIPVINFSSIFRPNQMFFRRYGAFYRSFLFKFNHILVQNGESLHLLNKIDYKKGVVCGDTRFDRVLEVSETKTSFPIITKFKGPSKLLVLGSVWPSDMKIIGPALKELMAFGIRIVIVPHLTDNNSIDAILDGIDLKVFKYSMSGQAKTLEQFDLLVIDEMGLLAAIYGQADMAYIGGAFRGTLHNTLEAAAHGIPVIFGKHPTNAKFKEAEHLLNIGAAFEINSAEEFLSILRTLLSDHSLSVQAGILGRNYVSKNGGATNRIINVVNEYLSPYK
ncbi:MAG: 3-deoxy-D-manno-octulosonic acid transferase [Bacteroidetes bacterium]|nr:3-deoxy-D-manno-octulosonic acid transferase [Bacteroidota bacterium]MDA1122433.1 3-deoxy-D-manno-octulosonic acid transferase [Bacteroidota bacterium]